MGRLTSLILSSAVLAGFASTSAFAAGINDYAFKRSFTLSSANGGTAFDPLPDGRLLTVNGNAVSVETAADSGTFVPLGTISGFSPASYGASFLSVSPDGTRAAIGNNNGSVTVFSTAAPAIATSYAMGDSDANWADNTRLAVTNFGQVQVLNTTSGQIRTVVGNIGGYSAGVTFDAAGNLYTGNGYDNAAGGTDTGWIKAFSKTTWEAAASGGSALNFETGGVAVADLLSAGSLGFDNSGNFYVGGADTFGSGEGGFIGLISAAGIQSAYASGSTTPVITAASPAGVLRQLSGPNGPFAFPSVNYNAATGELYVRDNGVINVYSVPEPAGLCGLALVGVAALRRRRRAVAAAAVAATASIAPAGYVYDPLSFATEVVSTNLPGTSLYTDAAAVLGRPTLKFNNGNAASPDYHRVKLIEGTYNTGTDGQRLITTFNAGQTLTVKMGRPVTNDAAHPFGVDFNVFGNAFFTPVGATGFVGDATNLNAVSLASPFVESVRVSVSPDNVNWYAYTNGPTGDGYFPTNSYRWDRTAAAWTDEESDPTKAVNPALASTLVGMTAADALDAYNGAAGGAGFDLAEAVANGGAIYSSIQYVRFDGLTGYSGGEIDAVAAVPEPAIIGIAGLLAVAGLRRNRA